MSPTRRLLGVALFVGALAGMTYVNLNTSADATAVTPVPGRLLASQCAQCHGPDGSSVADIDGLAGAEAKDLFDKLRDMADGDDRGIMHLQARGYTTDQLRAIAEFYASLPDPAEDDDEHEDRMPGFEPPGLQEDWSTDSADEDGAR